MDDARLDFARGVIVGAIVLAVVLNLVQFPVIERAIGRTYAAFNRYETSDVVDVVAAHTPTVRARFELYMHLRDWARGAEVLVGPRAGLQRDHLAGLSAMGDVTHWDGRQLTADERARIDAQVVATGEDRWAGPYAVAIAGQDVSRIASFRTDDRLLLVDERLLEEPLP